MYGQKKTSVLPNWYLLPFLALVSSSSYFRDYLPSCILIFFSFHSVVGFLHSVTGKYHDLNCNRIISVSHVSQITTNRKLQKRCHGYEDRCCEKNNWFYRKFVLKRYWHGFTWSLSLVNLWLHVFQWSRRSNSTFNRKTTKKWTTEIGRYIVLRLFNGTLSSAETIL